MKPLLLLVLPLPFLSVPPADRPPEARLLPIAGKPFRGRLLGIRGGKASFLVEGKKPGGAAALSLEAIEEIDFASPSPAPPAGPFLFLPGGESLPLQGIRPGRKGGLKPLFFGKWLKEVPLEKTAGFQWPKPPGRGLPASIPGLDPSRRPRGRDILYLVEQKGRKRDILEVAGSILSLERGGLVFDFAGKEHRVPLWKVAGALLGAPAGKKKEQTPPPERPGQAVEFTRGGRLLGRILGGDASGFLFHHPLLGEFRIPGKAVLRLRPSLDRVRPVDSLELLSDRAVPAFDRVWPIAVDKNLEGGPIRIHGRYFEKGLVFLPRRTLVFRVPRGFRLFKAALGIEDSGGGKGAALFRVLAGKREVFKKLIRASGDPVEVRLDLDGARTLTLEADFGPDLDLGDHCAFARARLLRPPAGKEER